ncbi:KR-domain-containing protein [Wolfiporia cocos MD-104 SS10]|uniref:KR-domain-containing protein n=1 Tax=Wolfiporia cocos (strain MD-104) TaxID=742152 RepID=A0A2H3JMX8_WOLCO|nr:KR-domain-containing protein [Wolfiporia cocos MD-104 SS10]
MTAAAVAGRVLFASSVVSQAISSPSTQTPRVILHAGNSSPASIATYSYLKARNIDVLVTFNNRHASPLAEVQDTHCQIFASSPCSVWSFHARAWASKGVDVAFNFDTNLDIAKETIQLLSNGGSLINIGHESPHRVRRGQRYLSVDPKTILNSLNSMQTALDIATPSMLAALAPATEAFSLDRLSTTYQMAQAPSAVDVAVLMDLRTIDPQLSILRGGILKGTNAFDPRASYVIIGGVGGLGANIARCLVENGARHVALTSRSGEDVSIPSYIAGRLMQEKKIISSLRAIPGVEIDIFAVDCLDAPKTKQMFASLSRRLAGVFYVAARLNDQRFTNLKSEDDWRIVHDVKVKGVKVLLEAVDPKLLDFLVLTSSMATVSGSPGQANYAAAQTEMEAIGSRLPNTVCVLVPPITDGGVFVRALPPGNARNAALDKYKALGMTGIRVATHCVDAIWSLNTPSEIKVYVPPVNWKKVCELGIPDYQLASLRHLLVKETTEVGSNRESTEQSIRATCAMVLSLEVDDLEENIPLSSYGLDSLTSVRLSGILKQYFNIAVTQLQLLSRHMTGR